MSSRPTSTMSRQRLAMRLTAFALSFFVSVAARAQEAGAPAADVGPRREAGEGLAPVDEGESGASPSGPVERGGERMPQVDAPWRLSEAAGAHPWLRFGLEHRMRFEYLQDDFRSTATGNSAAMSLRTLLSAELRLLPLVVGAELQDSRAFAAEQAPLNTTIVNPLEFLQAYVGLRREGLLASGDSAALTLGRFTMDVGSRRLMARNDFRNTVNSFTGVDLQWTSRMRHTLRAFAVLPVVRLPTDTTALSDNRSELDRENTDALFWGVFYGSPALAAGVQLEAYVLGLHERDGTDVPSSNRRLVTPVLRALRAPAPGKVDFQLETMFQLGVSRLSPAPTDTTDLTHRALSAHVSGGYRFDAVWVPRVALQYDFASGDDDPNDRVNGRFDPLYGARRFDFGPTGLYGAFARSNVSSPGLRVEVTPHRKVDAFAAYRLFWLASARDAWTTAGLRDAMGGSGSFLGQQLEARIRWQALPRNLVFEVGGAYVLRGGFAQEAPGARSTPPAFVYTQVTGTI